MFPNNEVFKLADMVEFKKGHVTKNMLINEADTKVLVVAIDQAILPTHAAPLNALVYAMEGSAVITCEGVDYPISAGESFLFKKGQLHSVASDNQYKMVLFMSSDQM